MSEQLFYVYDKPAELGNNKEKNLEGLTVKTWKPSIFSIIPDGQKLLPFCVWWLFHIFHVFFNRKYKILLVSEGDKVIHRSCIFPGYLRFPFMGKNDIQVGDIWTDEDFRGRGIAAEILRRIVADYSDDCKIWYLVDSENKASIRVVEKNNFICLGSGRKHPLCGLKILGSYRLDHN